MKVVIIDGQGGRLGQLLVESIIREKPEIQLLVIGTNSMATSAMLKAGARQGATGENPVVVACRDADIILGPIGILSADALLGEITPKMAAAVGQSSAVKLLLPVSGCNHRVVGVKKMSLSELVNECVKELMAILDGKNED